ncbi:hypothetical protein BGW39_011354 [Mortierella sp. 14UC]|nr:hypothetical protein BGW39_011354 [Mortierella sp. 14UC]
MLGPLLIQASIADFGRHNTGSTDVHKAFNDRENGANQIERYLNVYIRGSPDKPVHHELSVYLMRRCGNMYVMVHVRDVSIPDSMNELATIGAEYNIWFELALTVESGIKPVLNAAAKGKVMMVHLSLSVGKMRFQTVSTRAE